MTRQNQLTFDGFGRRLKSERKRLKLSQDELATAGGVKRLAQINYENEVTYPSIKYLYLISEHGVNIEYLIFGENTPDYQAQEEIENHTFELLELCAKRFPEGKLSADVYKTLFKLIKSTLLQVKSNQLPADYDPMTTVQPILPKVNHGK